MSRIELLLKGVGHRNQEIFVLRHLKAVFTSRTLVVLSLFFCLSRCATAQMILSSAAIGGWPKDRLFLLDGSALEEHTTSVIHQPWQTGVPLDKSEGVVKRHFFSAMLSSTT